LFVERFRLQELHLVRTFACRIRFEKLLRFCKKRRRIRVVDIDQSLIRRVFRFLSIRIFGDNLSIKFFSFVGVIKLPLAVCGEQHHFGLGRLRKLFLLFLVISQQLRVLTGLVLQPAQSHLRDCPEFSGFRKASALLQ
jgi:hypothetical protein